MHRPTVDLTAHLNQTVERGHPADFPVTVRPVAVRTNSSFTEIPNRLAVVRTDTNEPLAVVSDRYTLVPHQRILDVVGQATANLDVGAVPRGIYVDRGGARMRALFKFPTLAQPLSHGDEICPCLKVQNTYDGTSRIGVHIGAFRFVCTNLAVGGGGAFAGGFMAVHAGEIPIAEVAEQLSSYLAGFDRISQLYRWWSAQPITADGLNQFEDDLPKRIATVIRGQAGGSANVFDAYNAATAYATHQMRSYRAAFDALARINGTFQKHFPVSRN